MKLHGNVKILSLYMDGQLDEKTSGLLESHLKDCGECRETLVRMRKTRDIIAATPPVEAPAYLEREILEKLTPAKTGLKKFYVPALGALAAMAVAFIVILGSLKETYTPSANLPPHGEQVYRNPAVASIDEKQTTGGPRTEKPALYAARERMDDGLLEATDEQEKRDEETDADKSEPAGIPAEKVTEKEEALSLVYVGPSEDISAARKSKAMAPMKTESAKHLPGAIVIRDKGEWTAVWHTQNTVQNLSLPLPEVDFSEKMVVAVPSRTQDKEYVVVNTAEEKDKIIVQYRERPLQTDALPPYLLNVVNQKPVVELQKID